MPCSLRTSTPALTRRNLRSGPRQVKEPQGLSGGLQENSGGSGGARTGGEAEVLGKEPIPLPQDEGALDGVLELPHVSGPGIRLQRPQGLRRERDLAAPLLLGREFLREVPRQDRHV